MNKRLLNKKHRCWLHYADNGLYEITEKPIKSKDEISLHLGDEITVVTERNMELHKIPTIEVKGWNDYSIWGSLPNGLMLTFVLVDIIYIMNAY